MDLRDKSGSNSTKGQVLYHPPKDVPTQQIGPYEATYHASGLFSTVYRAHLPSSPTAIAIKLTTPSAMTAPHNSFREARLLHQAAHPSIIPLLSTEKLSGGHFLLTFTFAPHDLSTLLSAHVLTDSQIRAHLYDLFTALEHIHALGILHRDIKPSNLLLAAPEGPTYLADFGIAWQDGDPDSEPSTKKITDVGTTRYRAPELLFGYSGYGVGVDLWGAGCVVAEAANRGKSLFDAGRDGSELALLKSIFTTLGTPNDTAWPVSVCHFSWRVEVVNGSSRKQIPFQTGAKCSSQSIPRRTGTTCYVM